MRYELAKSLKDAGFPQRDDRALFETDHVSYPTLEELIEECGDKLHHLVHYFSGKISHEHWGAWREPPIDPDEMAEGYYANTPAEAVARLWLALNKK